MQPHKICQMGNVTRLWALVWNKAVNAQELCDPCTDNSLVHVACSTRLGTQNCLAWLLTRPGAIEAANKRNKAGQTALHISARRHGATRALRFLLQLPGMNVDARDNYESTALLDAVCEELPDTVELLLKAKADPNIFVPNCHGHGNSPLICATRLKNAEVVEQLLAVPEIDVHQKSLIGVPFGKTAAEFAVSKEIKALFEKRARDYPESPPNEEAGYKGDSESRAITVAEESLSKQAVLDNGKQGFDFLHLLLTLMNQLSPCERRP